MELMIVYDNEVFKKGVGLKSDWGFSCLIKTSGENILFDCGAKGEILLNNMKRLNIKPEKINKIVISHEHWDHNGGLKSLLPFVEGAELYRLGEDGNAGKLNLISIKDARIISEGIYTTGRLPGKPVDEQSLVLKGKKGWYVLAGCSHPGVGNILQAAREIGKIVGIIGGFHGFNNFSVLKSLDLIYPCHCTAHKKEIRTYFPNSSFECGVGKTIDLNVEI